MPLIDMKRPKSHEKDVVAQSTADQEEEYPYCLRIQLENYELVRLNKKITDFKVGEKVTIEAESTVVEISQHTGEGREHDSTVSLQIKQMAISTKKKSSFERVADGMKVLENMEKG